MVQATQSGVCTLCGLYVSSEVRLCVCVVCMLAVLSDRRGGHGAGNTERRVHTVRSEHAAVDAVSGTGDIQQDHHPPPSY